MEKKIISAAQILKLDIMFKILGAVFTYLLTIMIDSVYKKQFKVKTIWYESGLPATRKVGC